LISEPAEREKIPDNFLELIFLTLRNLGFLLNKKRKMKDIWDATYRILNSRALADILRLVDHATEIEHPWQRMRLIIV